MTLKSIRKALLGAAFFAAMLAQPTQAYKDSTVVAKVTANGKTEQVTVADLKDIMEMIPGEKGKSFEDRYERLLRQGVDMTLLYAASVKRGLLKDPKVKKQVARCQKAMPQLALRQAEAKKIDKKMLQEIHGKLVKQFPRGQKSYNLSVIVVKSKKDADAILKDVKNGKNFVEVCKAKSLHPSKEWNPACALQGLTRDDMPIEVAAKVVKSAPATVVPSVISIKSWNGKGKIETLYWIVKVDSIKKAEAPTLNDPKVARLVNEIAMQKITLDLVKKLRDEAKVEMFDLKGKKMEPKKEEAKN